MSKYTGDINNDLQIIIPEIVAGTVTTDLEEQAYLVHRAKVIYERNPSWGRKIARENNKARDMLHAFMEHWIEALRKDLEKAQQKHNTQMWE